MENAAAAPDAEPRKEGGFHQRKFGQKFEKKKFDKKKFGKKPFDKKKPGSYPPKRPKQPQA